jgi:hypothetical protein
MEFRLAHFKIWVPGLLAGLLLFGPLAPGRAMADPPRDEASLWTEFGPDLLVGSITARRHFMKPETSSNEMLFSRRQREVTERDLGDDPEAAGAPRRRWQPAAETSELSWKLGYAYARPSAADRAVFDLDSHSGLVGLDWESSPRDIFQFAVTADFVPTLKYKAGAMLFRFAHSDHAPWSAPAPLRRSKPSATGNANANEGPVVNKQTLNSPFGGVREGEETASEYFRRHSRIYGDALVGQAPFDWEPPVYTFAALFEVHSHNSEDSGTSRGLSQIGLGPELDLRLDSNWSFGLSGRFFFYSEMVTEFLGSRPAGSTYYATFPSALGAVSGGLEGSTLRPWAYTFPDMIFEQSVSYDLDDDFSFGLNTNETLYVIDGQPFGLGGTLWGRYAIDADWQIGAGAELVYNSAATTFAGFLNLSYLF